MDYCDVLADPAVALVSICLPSGLDGEISVTADETGKCVVCENYLQIRPERAQAISSCRLKRSEGPGHLPALDYARGEALGNS